MKTAATGCHRHRTSSSASTCQLIRPAALLHGGMLSRDLRPVIKRYAEGAMSHALSRKPERFAFGQDRRGIGRLARRASDRPAGFSRCRSGDPERSFFTRYSGSLHHGCNGRHGRCHSCRPLRSGPTGAGACDRGPHALGRGAGFSGQVGRPGKNAGGTQHDRQVYAQRAERCKPGLRAWASGIGLALLELAVATGAFAPAPRRRSETDQESGHWPDLRREIGDRTAPVAWCHGAAGIGLTRLRLWELTGEEMYRDQARLAVSLTIEAIVRSKRQDGNWSLCHGLLGNLETLIMAEDSLGTSHADTISDVLDFGRAAFTDQRRSWCTIASPQSRCPA